MYVQSGFRLCARLTKSMNNLTLSVQALRFLYYSAPLMDRLREKMANCKEDCTKWQIVGRYLRDKAKLFRAMPRAVFIQMNRACYSAVCR
jgi:hypothetical protein